MKKRLFLPTVQGVLLMSLFSPLSASDEIRSSMSDQSAVAITIYNQDLALVKDERNIVLAAGENTIAFRGVSGGIRPETAILVSSEHPGSIQIIEQNFDYDLLTPSSLLNKFLGKEVSFISTNPVTGKETREQATVLSTQGGVVLKIGDRIETDPPGRFVFPSLPSNLRDLPTLLSTVESRQAGPQQLELAYLTGGLSWKADYIAELSSDESQIDLQGWVTLNNQSGTAYNSARLQLVAGDVNRVREQPRMMMKAEMMLADSVAAPSMSEESLLDYHLYSLSRKTTLENNQTKQVSLLAAASVPVVKEYVLRGGGYYYQGRYAGELQKDKVEVFLALENNKKNGLGLPLPKGVVRVYKKDSNGSAQFVGEDSIDHTPDLGSVDLKLGNAFDVTAERVQSDFRKMQAAPGFHTAYRSSYELELSNAKEASVSVSVREGMPGNWKLTRESHKSAKLSASMAEWVVEVPAKGSTTLTYTVEVHY